MRSVRCDVCGTKALMAASRCPKCGHLFEVRDGSGEPLPLAHCSSCDAYYPAHVDSCKWCGTTLRPEKTRKDTSVTKWIAGGAFIAAVLLGLLARDPRPKLAARLRESAQARPKPATPTDTATPVVANAPIDTVAPVDTTPAGGSTVLSDVSPPQPTPTPAVEVPVPQAAPPTVIAAAPIAVPARASSRAAPSKPRATSPWVSLVAQNWVIVRADAHGKAHIVASVGPNARVQLGESRGSWRRIRSRGIAGWVDVSRASFSAPPRQPRRAGRVAER